jgi:hypothetical protein
MSLKSVEMQFVLHKNDEAGLKQNQLIHKPENDQTLLGEAAAKQLEKERRISPKTTETSKGIIHEDGASGHHKSQQDQLPAKAKDMNEQRQKDKDKGKHPFKGHHIDLSL